MNKDETDRFSVYVCLYIRGRLDSHNCHDWFFCGQLSTKHFLYDACQGTLTWTQASADFGWWLSCGCQREAILAKSSICCHFAPQDWYSTLLHSFVFVYSIARNDEWMTDSRFFLLSDSLLFFFQSALIRHVRLGFLFGVSPAMVFELICRYILPPTAIFHLTWSLACWWSTMVDGP